MKAITCTYESRQPSGKHGEGAMALVKHRGVQNFETDVSKRLLIAIRSQSVSSLCTK
jgi:hypothetical protein